LRKKIECIDQEKYKFLLLLKIYNIDKLKIESRFKIIQNIKKSLRMYNENEVKYLNVLNNDILIFISSEEILNKFLLTTLSEMKRENMLISSGEIKYLVAVSEIIKSIEISINELEITMQAIEKENHIKNQALIKFFNTSDKFIQHEMEDRLWYGKTIEIINNQAIIPYYQAIKDIKTGKILKYEVLARAIYDNKIIPPYFFISKAEELGMLYKITEIILDKSFKFFSTNNYEFNINISANDLLRKDFICTLKNYLDKYNLDPKRVTFEVLENITNMHENSIIETLHKIKDIGCKIAIDDFGSENSNFSRLININCDFIKIDAIFIKDILNNPKNIEIVSSIVNMSKALKIKTVAEFVENKDIYDLIKKCGVDYAQGYYIDKPKELIWTTPKGGSNYHAKFKMNFATK